MNSECKDNRNEKKKPTIGGLPNLQSRNLFRLLHPFHPENAVARSLDKKGEVESNNFPSRGFVLLISTSSYRGFF